MLNVQCRLCSSSRALISLFGGKCRRNRDYIRKLVDVTTGIKFQKNDAYKCICFACTVQIYNFYIFRSQSVLNENILQASAESNEKPVSNKVEVKSLDDIILPSVNELKETLTPWLTSKQEYCETVSNENVKSADRRNSVPGECNCYNVRDKQLIENSTQYDSVELIDKSTIYDSSSVEVSSQTDKLKTKTVKLQCQLLRTSSKKSDISTQTSADNIFYNTVNTVNKETQYEVSSVAVHTQTKKLPVKHVKLQCELEKTNSEIPITESKVPITQHNEGICSPKECFNKETQHEPTTVEVHTQTNNLVTENLKTRKQLARINRKSLLAKNKESATQTESAKEVICPHLPSELTDNEDNDLKTNLRVVDIKEEGASVSPSILSPLKCLNVNIDSAKNETASPLVEYSSPKSPDLLAIKNKVQSVIICKECDQTIYSKNQYRLHRKSHMRCNFCKESFRSVKKAKFHMQNDCTIQKSIKIEPIVSLARLESITSLQDTYPECFELLKQFNNKGYNQSYDNQKKVIRIRSRSISSIDSFINCNTCRSCISVLNGISVGVDKSIQVNLFFDKDLMVSPLNYLYKNLYLKNCLKQSIENDGVPIKKIKLSPLENN